MTTQEMMRQRFAELYQMMASQTDVSKMQVFGDVMKAAMEWAISNRPDLAGAWMEELERTAWKNYLTPKEADKIVADMEPKAPWTREQWRVAMQQRELPLEEEPCYNKCAMFVTMSMIYSDSINTLTKFAGSGDVFEIIHELAKDKLKDKDGVFNVRKYFGL